MKRIVTAPRPNWQKTVESQGFTFHSNGVKPDGIETFGTNWYEGAYYEFQTPDYNALHSATKELHHICLEAVKKVAGSEYLMSKLGIPLEYHDLVWLSMHENHPSIYGRMDLGYNGVTPPVLLEYNADTPTCLIESAVVQWAWLEEKFDLEKYDQFNSLHDKLIARWRDLSDMIGNEFVFFTANQGSIEEYATVEYLRDTCNQAFVPNAFIDMKDVGWNGSAFTDLQENEIPFWFKLYPWEWLVKEDFGQHLHTARLGQATLEPAWKMILSNKGILPILWEMFPNHPNLLESYWKPDTPMAGNWVEKPTLSREGANIRILNCGTIKEETFGSYAQEPRIIQKRFMLPKFDDQYAVVGSWIIGDEPAGIIMREDESPIIIDRSRVVPHVFV
jgi:glutathionylspermidine synthase